jgi:tetratricopeptide (TPR) repeat protein
MKIASIILTCFVVVLTSKSVNAQDSTAAYYFKKGDFYYRNFDYQPAVDYFTKAIKIEPEHINALLERGFSRNVLKDYAGAVEDFTAVINLNPNHRWAYVSRGSSRNKIGEYNLAIEDFNKALELDPTDQEAYNNRGFSKKMSGDKEGACTDWNKSKKLGNEEAKIILKNNYCK